jgi:hypothetical protein
MKQIIKDFICEIEGSRCPLIMFTWRDSAVKLADGALASLVAQGQESFRKPFNNMARIGERLHVVDCYGAPQGNYKVLAISLTLWDYSMPIGKRSLKVRTTDNWKEIHEKYQEQYRIQTGVKVTPPPIKGGGQWMKGKGFACKSF